MISTIGVEPPGKYTISHYAIPKGCTVTCTTNYFTKKYADIAYKYWYTPTAPSIPYTIKIYLISSMITPKANPEPNKPKQ